MQLNGDTYRRLQPGASRGCDAPQCVRRSGTHTDSGTARRRALGYDLTTSNTDQATLGGADSKAGDDRILCVELVPAQGSRQ